MVRRTFEKPSVFFQGEIISTANSGTISPSHFYPSLAAKSIPIENAEKVYFIPYMLLENHEILENRPRTIIAAESQDHPIEKKILKPKNEPEVGIAQSKRLAVDESSKVSEIEIQPVHSLQNLDSGFPKEMEVLEEVLVIKDDALSDDQNLENEFVIDLTQDIEKISTEPINIEFETKQDLEFEIDLTEGSFIKDVIKINQDIESHPIPNASDDPLSDSVQKEDLNPESIIDAGLLKEEIAEAVDTKEIDLKDNEEKIESKSIDSRDFTSWLTQMKRESDDDTKSGMKSIDSLQENKLVENQVIESIDFLEPRLNIAKDDELEGVLRDKYLVSQMDLRKKMSKDESRSKTEENDSKNGLNVVSETIAILYSQQDNIPKAIEVYKKLIQKFPEKSAFFASQIEKLKK